MIVEKLLSKDWEVEDDGSGGKEAGRKRNVPRMTHEGDCVVSGIFCRTNPAEVS